MEKKKTRVRLDYLDIAKCLAIFLVVMGHAPDNAARPFYRLILYAFHMPLFFMVSGVVIRKHQTSGYGWDHWKDFLIKNFLALVVPYFIWGIIFAPFYYSNLPKLFYASWQALGSIGTVTSLWYLPCLFLARIEMELILMSHNLVKKMDRHLYAALWAAVAFVIGFSLPKLENGYPWCLDSSFVALGFLLLGYATKDFLNSLQSKKTWLSLVILAVSSAVFVSFIWYCRSDMYLVLMCSSDYGDPLRFFIGAFSGSGIILSLSVLLAKYWETHEGGRIRSFVIWAGKNTLGIFLLHKPLLQQVFIQGLFQAIGFTQPEALVAFAGTLLTFPLACLMTWGIQKTVPQLFGRFSLPSPKEKA